MPSENSFRDNTTGVTYEAVEVKNLACKGCAFDLLDCVRLVPLGCTPSARRDHRSIIWVIQESNEQDNNHASHSN